MSCDKQDQGQANAGKAQKKVGVSLPGPGSGVGEPCVSSGTLSSCSIPVASGQPARLRPGEEVVGEPFKLLGAPRQGAVIFGDMVGGLAFRKAGCRSCGRGWSLMEAVGEQ